MDIWYAIIDRLLPFAWTEHLFMKNALLAVLLVTPVFAMLGTMVVSNKMAFYSEALGHSALTGIGLGVIFGLQDPLFSMVGFAVLLAVAISLVKNSGAASTDTVIGVFSAASVALGIVILSRGRGFDKYTGYLIGDLLNITPVEIGLLVVIFLVVIMLWGVIFNRLLLAGINPSLAYSRGINVRLTEIVFAVIMAIMVTVSIQWIGLLIITSLLVLPAAAARNITQNTRRYMGISVLVAIISGLSGLIFSYYWNTATGATMVLVASFIFILTFLFKPWFN